MRAVLDPNVLISAIIGLGPPAEILAAWERGDLEIVVSDYLLDELSRALARPKLSTRVTADDAAAFVELLRRAATLEDDPPFHRRYSSDPDDDYLVALAHASHAMLVSGDSDLLDLAPELPILSPRQFLTETMST